MEIIEGMEIITVGRFGQKCANFKSGGTRFSIPIWSAKTYVAKKNRKGVLKWFFKECFGRTVASHTPSDKFIQEVKEYKGTFMFDIVHLMKIKQESPTLSNS